MRNSMKSRIFIGSSVEGLAVANQLKNKLSTNFDVNIWTDDLFEANDSTLGSILKFVHAFDFGIFVATPDDEITNIKRDGAPFQGMRDNVLLEFGIFLGVLGRSSSFLMLQEEVKMPSDMLGISSFRYKITDDKNAHNGLDKVISKINKTLLKRDKQTYYSLLPSTSIAISYFSNFLNRFANHIGFLDCIELDGRNYTPVCLKVVIPDNLRGDIHERVQALYKKLNLSEGKITLGNGGRSLTVNFREENNVSAIVYDMPTSLSGIDDAIKSVVHDGTATISEHQKLIEQRELRNFTKVLQAKIADSSFGSDHIEIIAESEIKKSEMI